MPNERFKDENLSKYAFSDKILVHCPKCEKQATVHFNEKTGEKTLTCSHCFHVEKGSNTYYQVSTKAQCVHCGEKIEAQLNSKEKIDNWVLTCSKCGNKQSYTPKNMQIRVTSWNFGTGLDPHFGYSLWLQGEVKGHLFWAFNYEHLDYLKRYIAAKIRERADSSTFMTLVARLPSFIKSAKNRTELLKLIDKLELKK